MLSPGSIVADRDGALGFVVALFNKTDSVGKPDTSIFSWRVVIIFKDSLVEDWRINSYKLLLSPDEISV